MAVELIPVGLLKTYVQGQERVTFEPGLTVAEMIEAAGIPPDLVALAMVEGAGVPRDYRPRDGETVKVMAVIGGGQSGQPVDGEHRRAHSTPARGCA